MNSSVNESISANIMTGYDIVTVDQFPGGTGIFLFTTLFVGTDFVTQPASCQWGKLIGAWN
jgi:hypothetical protein